MWVAAIAGKMGEGIEGGFGLEKPNIQVFERQPKEPKPEGEEAAKYQWRRGSCLTWEKWRWNYMNGCC